MIANPGQVFHFLKPRNTVVMIATVAMVLGIAARSPLLLGISIMCIASLGVALAESARLLKHMKVRRHHHERVFQGNSVVVSLELEAVDRAAPELLLVEDYFPPSTTSRLRRLIECEMRRGMITTIGFFGLCEHRRGLYVLGPVSIQAYDAFGFFPRQLTIDVFTDLMVYPQAVDLASTRLLGEGTLPHVGLEIKPRVGASEEFAGIREYRPGDPTRLIHWRSTARHGRPMVKEFEEERTTLVTFFLDLGRQGLVGIGDQTSVEYGIKCCASMAKRAVERGHRVSLLSVGSVIDFLPPGAGMSHLVALLDRLVFLKPEGDSALPEVVSDHAKSLPRGSTAVLLLGATTVEFDSIARALGRLLYRQILPIVVLIDDRAFIKIYRDQEERHHGALPLEEIVRRVRILGAQVHVVRRARSMEQALLQGLEREEMP